MVVEGYINNELNPVTVSNMKIVRCSGGSSRNAQPVGGRELLNCSSTLTCNRSGETGWSRTASPTAVETGEFIPRRIAVAYPWQGCGKGGSVGAYVGVSRYVGRVAANQQAG